MTVPPPTVPAKPPDAPARPFLPDHFIERRISEKGYAVSALMARGDTGATFSGRDRKTGRRVVIKVIQFTKIPDVRILHLFKRGVGVLKHLDHPLIPVHVDSFSVNTDTEEFHVLVQERIKGDNLLDLIAGGRRFSIGQVHEILKSLLEILSYIHNLQPPVIHRDINPKNIIIDETGRAHLVDFGAVGNIVTDSPLADIVHVGTMGYMAPEQSSGRAMPVSDLYAAGVSMIYLLSGTDPLEMELKHGKLDFRRHCNAPADFLDLLDEMVEPDENKRIKSARHALTKLGKIMGYAATGVLEKTEPQLTALAFFTRLFSAKNPGEIFRIFTREMPMEVRVGLFALIFILLLTHIVSIFNRPEKPVRPKPGQTMDKTAVQNQVDSVLAEKEAQRQKIQQERMDRLKKFSPGARTEKEPNDALSQAMDISMGTVAGITDSGGKPDWYRFPVPNGYILSVLLENAMGSDGVLHQDLYDAKQARVFPFVSAGPGQKAETLLMMNKTSGGFYYVQVKGEKKDLLYRLTISARFQNDGGMRSDAGDDPASVVSIDPAKPVKGRIGGMDQKDWYQLYVPGGSVFSLGFTAGPEAEKPISLKLVDKHNNQIWRDPNVNARNVRAVEIPFPQSPDTDLYLEVGYSHSRIAAYEFQYAVTRQNDGDTHGDAGGKPSRAVGLMPGNEISGILGGLDQKDWYVFPPKTGQTMEFTTAETGDFRLSAVLFDADGNRIWSASRLGPMVKRRYHVRRIRDTGGGSPVQYSLMVTCIERNKKTCANGVMPYRIIINNPD